MAAITLQEAKEMLELWMEANRALATRKTMTIGGRSYSSADANEIQKNIQYWRAEVSRLSRGGGIRIMRVIPCD